MTLQTAADHHAVAGRIALSGRAFLDGFAEGDIRAPFGGFERFGPLSPTCGRSAARHARPPGGSDDR